MNDDELWDRVATIERKIEEATNIRTERARWDDLFNLLCEAGHEDLAEATRNSIAYRTFEVREAWRNLIDPVILGLPRPLKWLVRKMK